MTITNFAAGELSQNLKGRIDIGSYYAGCQKLKNFEIIPTGGIKKRTGMKRKGALHGNCRLIPFIINKDNNYLLEFVPKPSEHEDGKIYVWKNGEPLPDVTGKQIEIKTSYASLSEIKEIQFAQNYDTMIFVHRNYKPFQITYNFAEEKFTYGDMTFNFFVDVNMDDDYDFIEIADKGLPPGTDGKYCIYNGHLYKYSGTESKWIIQGDDPETDTGLFTTDRKYPGCVAFFQNRLFFASTLENQQRIWASAAPDTKGPRYNKFGLYQKYVTVNKSIKNPDLHLFTANIDKKNVKDGKTILTNVSQDFTADGTLEKAVTEYFCTNDTFVPIGTKVVSFTASTITINREIKIDEDKEAIVFSLSLWRNSETASADDYEYVVVNTNMTTSDVGFYLEPASDQNDAIKWLAPGSTLVAGTETNVWNIPSGVNALNVGAYMNGRYGSDDIQAHVVATSVIFFAQGKQGIREYTYNAQTQAFVTNNIAIQAEQMLTESPAVDFDFMTNPYNKLIITRKDGTAVQLLYDRNNGVMGWNRIEREYGALKSCAVVRGESFCDIVYFAVQDEEGIWLEEMNEASEVYLDGYKAYLEGGDYSDYDNTKAIILNVTKGKSILLNEPMPEDFMENKDIVYVGYTFNSLILSMPVMAGDVSSKKRIVNLFVRFQDSYMPVMKTTDMPDEFFTDVVEPFSGVKKIDYPGASDIDVTFSLESNEPKKISILSVDASVTA